MNSVKKANYIVFSVNNFKKTLFEFYKTDYNFINLNYYSIDKKEFILIYFNFDNYLTNKNVFISFLNDNDIYFNILCVKYKNNYYEYNFFEQIINEQDDCILDDFLMYIFYVQYIKKNIQNKILIFSYHKLFFDLNNIIKCQLFIKQLQK